MSVVVGIDPSLTSAGIAVLDGGFPVFVHSLGNGGRAADSYVTRNRRIRAQVLAVCTAVFSRCTPDLLVIEGPSYGSDHGAQFDRAALWHGIVGQFDRQHVPFAVVAPRTRAKWATGKGGASKLDSLAAVRATWSGVVPIMNHDIADALTLAEIGARKLGEPLPFELRRRHVEAIEVVAWPEQLVTA